MMQRVLAESCQCHEQAWLCISTVDDTIQLKYAKIFGTINLIALMCHIGMMMACVQSKKSNEKAARDHNQQPEE